MKTYGDFFTGFGGMTIGAKEAGLDVLFGVEWDEDLAAVYRQNLGDHIMVADVTKLDMATLPYVDIFHASPPCTNASVAKANGEESPFDMAMANAVCRYIAHHKPAVFTMENVYQYRNFESWHEIAKTLLANGYTYNYWHVNMANYGVPQTRRRMIVVARRDGISPSLPEHTHAEAPQAGLFGTKKRWVSWYDAIEDLIPTLPESEFAPWQLERLPDEHKNEFIMEPTTMRNGGMIADRSNPIYTIKASRQISARAFIMNAANPNGNETKKYRAENEPSKTMTATDSLGIKAFLMSCGNANGSGNRPYSKHEPIPTITAGTGAKGGSPKMYQNGHVVKMTPRAIARFQSFPDWYELPDKASLAVKGLGNAVPPLFAEMLYESLTSA